MSDEPSSPRESGPFSLVRRVLDPDMLDWLVRLTASAYERVEKIREASDAVVLEMAVPPRGRFVVTASSFSLEAVLADGEIAGLLQVIREGPVWDIAARALGDRLALDVAQSWVRRQFPPGHAPRYHAPHGWHQDGALGFNFASPAVGDGLLEMVTCWMALTPCGVNAPGLELIAESIDDLKPVNALRDEELRRRFPKESFQQPVLESGDALVFPGGTLHRTHLSAEMQACRTSLELRLFPANRLPRRLRGDRFLEISPGR